MSVRWPLFRQLLGPDKKGFSSAAMSPRSRTLLRRVDEGDRVVQSVCPYCAVGCAQLVYVPHERITNIEGDPDSPISAGCLCPKGAATFQLVTGAQREKWVLHRR